MLKFGWKSFVAIGVLVLFATGCGGGGDEGGSKQLQLGSLAVNDHGTKDVSKASSVEVEVDSFYFNPSFLRGSEGEKLKLTLANESNTLHNFSVPSLGFNQDVPPNGKIDVDVTFPQSGAVLFFCKYHTGMGMNGELLVGTATPQPASAAAIAPVATTAPAAGSTPAAVAATIKVSDSSLGKIVTDAGGRTLYTFKNDVPNSGKSAVAGQLAVAWPPLVLATGNPVKSADILGEVTLITRDDGNKQVAYKGMPLYYFAQDTAPGETKGQGLGNVWFAATP